MKKRILAGVIAVLTALTALLPFAATPSFATGTHGFYMNCSASVTGYKTGGFLIDFFTDSTDALGTYWSNANWNMYVGASVEKLGYEGITGGGAYAGLQHNNATVQRAGIMSMWRWEYPDAYGNPEYIYADAMVGKSSHYSNEGSGTSCILPYDWESNRWYRELLYCWQDEETGYTFIGTWFYDYEKDEWSLHTYYNTYLADSYINTDITQFLENYSDRFNDRYRSFRYRNVYFQQSGSNAWISQPNVRVYTDQNPDAVGVCSMGISEDGTYVWGQVDGRPPLNVADPDYVKTERSFTLNQASQPTLGSPSIASFDVSDPSAITWETAKNSTPQLSYRLSVRDLSGNELLVLSGTRPEVRSLRLPELPDAAYACTLTLRDVFGKETTAFAASPSYLAQQENGLPSGAFDDPDGSGSCDIGDVTAVLNRLAGQNLTIDADVDGDGIAQIGDVTLLLNRLSGVEVQRYSKGILYVETPDGESYIVADGAGCPDETVRIPALYAAKPVVSIAPYAFAGKAITSVELPQSVTAIGARAFAQTALESVDLPTDLTALGEGAFENCAFLTRVSLPEGISVPAPELFAGCASLASVSFGKDLVKVEENAFDGCEKLTEVNYDGTAWWKVRILAGNDPLLGASVRTTKTQSAKNGLVQEDGGVRYYSYGRMRSGWYTIGGLKFYFDPDTGLMATGTRTIDAQRCRFAMTEYDELSVWALHDSEPDKKTAQQEWLTWLLSTDAKDASPFYKEFRTGRVYTVRRSGASAGSGWEFWGGKYQFDYVFDKSEVDLTESIGSENYPYLWEIFYRKAGSGDEYEKITTAPWSVYNVDSPIYRLPVFDDGMTDLSLAPDGSAQAYELLFVIYDGQALPENLIGWKQTITNYTDSSEGFKEDAAAAGAIDVPEEEFYYDAQGHIRMKSASCSNMASFGDINKPGNVLDGDQSTVCGSGFNGGSQSVEVLFRRPEEVSEIFLQCKDEGTTTNADGTRGTYDLYALYEGSETLIRRGVPAVTGTDGGYTVTLSVPVAADGLKVVISSWQGNCWACLADIYAKATGNTPTLPSLDEAGYILHMTASRSGFADFGDVNKPDNVLDGNQNTVCGSGYSASVEQSVTVTFPQAHRVTEVFLQCKDEGTTTNADGTRGSYEVYALKDGASTLLGVAPAVTGTNGGYTLTLGSPVEADAVKIVITSWQGNCWACVADVKVKAES